VPCTLRTLDHRVVRVDVLRDLNIGRSFSTFLRPQRTGGRIERAGRLQSRLQKGITQKSAMIPIVVKVPAAPLLRQAISATPTSRRPMIDRPNSSLPA
jgi:hypothetical protein